MSYGRHLAQGGIMSHIMDDLLYTRDHLWVLVEDSLATVGLTDFALGLVGDVTMVEPPEDDRDLHSGDEVAKILGREGEMAVCSPVSGQVTEVNQELEASPDIIGQDCYGMGWLYRVEMTRPSELDRLMEAEEYEAFLASEEET